MSRIVKSALLYFAMVFGVAFALGALRVFWIAPQLGARAAELLEMPVLFLVMLFAARFIVRSMHLEPTVSARLGMGAIALALVIAWDFTLVLWLRGLTLETYLATLDPVTGAAYYGMLVVYALLPLFVPPRIRRVARAAVASAVAVLGVTAAVLYASYRHDLELERERVAQGSELAHTACGPIEYASLGNGPAVLFVHGAGGGYDQMLDMARMLADAGFRVVAPSRFGYLRTPLPADASPAAQADAHACLLEALNIERAAVIGVSAGAPSSMQFALRHAERLSTLVLMVPLAYAPREPARLSPVVAFMLERVVTSDFLYWAAMTFDRDLVVGTVLGTPPEVLANADPDERARVATVMRHILPISQRRQGLMNEAAVAASLSRYELERIAAPTLLISARDDRYDTFVAARYTAEHMPHARFIAYDAGGHMLVGHEEQVTREITTFLGAVGPALP